MCLSIKARKPVLAVIQKSNYNDCFISYVTVVPHHEI